MITADNEYKNCLFRFNNQYIKNKKLRRKSPGTTRLRMEKNRTNCNGIKAHIQANKSKLTIKTLIAKTTLSKIESPFTI